MADRRSAGEAPGRLDFLGGVADYSGSLVLQTPTQCTTRVALEPIPGDVLEFHAADLPTPEVPLAPLRDALKAAASWPEMRQILATIGAPHWTHYPLGCLLVFARAKDWLPAIGLRFTVDSDVPQSLGVSSSAALEIATLRALASFAGRTFAGHEIAHLGQCAENHLVGAPCGLMDQLASAHGQPGKLLPILCRPDLCRDLVALPDGACIVGWPSAVKHAVSGSPYGTARTASFMGKCLLEESLGRKLRHTTEAPPSLLREVFAGGVHDCVRGASFLHRCHRVDDPLSQVVPDRDYPVRAATEFPIEENARCEAVLALLATCTPATCRDALTQIGAHLYQSHEGYGRMGLGAPETDAMVAAIRELGPARGFYGARISGGGSGGTVVVLCERAALPALEELGRTIPGASSRLVF
jgi:L-arabinokinase